MYVATEEFIADQEDTDFYFSIPDVRDEVVRYDIGGMFGRRMGRVIEISEAGLVVEDLFTRKQRTIRRGSEPYSVDRPFPDNSYTVEQVVVDGEVVEQIPVPSREKGRILSGYEQYEIVERTYHPYRDRMEPYKFRLEHLNGEEDFFDIENEGTFDSFVKSIKSDHNISDPHATVATVWLSRVDDSYQMKWFRIETPFKPESSRSTFEICGDPR